MGRPMKIRQHTFAVNDGDMRVVDRLTGFRRVCTAVCTHMPLAKSGDLLMMRVHSQHMVGEATILEAKEVETKNGKKTVLALQLSSEKEELTHE